MRYDYDERMIYDSIEKELEDQIEKLEAKSETLKSKIKETVLFEKARAKGELEHANKSIVSLNNVSSQLHSLRHYSGKANYKLPNDIMEHIQVLANSLDSEDYSKLKLAIDTSLYNENIGKPLNELKETTKNVENAARQADLLDKNITVRDGDKSAGNFTVKHLLEELNKYKNEEIISVEYKIDITKNNNIDGHDTRDAKFDNMIKNSNFSNNKSMLQIQNNYQKIIESQVIREQSSKNIEYINQAIEAFKNEVKTSNVDFDRVLVELNSIKKSNENKLREANAFLSKFDLNAMDKALEEYQKASEKEENIEDYKQLAYDYEKAVQEGNLVKAEEIRQHMLAQGEKYSNDEVLKMQEESKQQLYDDERMKRITKEEEQKEQEKKSSMSAREMFDIADNRNNEEIEEQREMINYSYDKLRDLAIKRLEQKGQEVDLEKDQKLINNEISEMVRIANMTPQERAKEDGVTNQNDYNFYADSMMDFNVRDVRSANWQYQDNMRVQATNIYKEYIKYLAKTPDKDSAVKFSEFAARAYGYSNMTEDMIDEEVMSEGRSR